MFFLCARRYTQNATPEIVTKGLIDKLRDVIYENMNVTVSNRVMLGKNAEQVFKKNYNEKSEIISLPHLRFSLQGG